MFSLFWSEDFLEKTPDANDADNINAAIKATPQQKHWLTGTVSSRIAALIHTKKPKIGIESQKIKKKKY